MRLSAVVLVVVALITALAPLKAQPSGNRLGAEDNTEIFRRPHRIGRVLPKSSTIYTMSFPLKEPAQVYARGDGDIDILVRDGNGKILAKDTDSDSSPVCVWNGKPSARYRIEVIGCEQYAVDYILFFNGTFVTSISISDHKNSLEGFDLWTSRRHRR